MVLDAPDDGAVIGGGDRAVARVVGVADVEAGRGDGRAEDLLGDRQVLGLEAIVLGLLPPLLQGFAIGEGEGQLGIVIAASRLPDADRRTVLGGEGVGLCGAAVDAKCSAKNDSAQGWVRWNTRRSEPIGGPRVGDTGVLPLLERVAGAVSVAIGRTRPEVAGADPVVRRSGRADFQSNVAFAVAERVGVRPSVLADTITELVDKGIAVQSDGALVVFSREVTGPDDRPVPLMVRKRDGGYGYDTTDLATIRYRVHSLHAQRLLGIAAPERM